MGLLVVCVCQGKKGPRRRTNPNNQGGEVEPSVARSRPAARVHLASARRRARRCKGQRHACRGRLALQALGPFLPPRAVVSCNREQVVAAAATALPNQRPPPPKPNHPRTLLPQSASLTHHTHRHSKASHVLRSRPRPGAPCAPQEPAGGRPSVSVLSLAVGGCLEGQQPGSRHASLGERKGQGAAQGGWCAVPTGKPRRGSSEPIPMCVSQAGAGAGGWWFFHVATWTPFLHALSPLFPPTTHTSLQPLHGRGWAPPSPRV